MGAFLMSKQAGVNLLRGSCHFFLLRIVEGAVCANKAMSFSFWQNLCIPTTRKRGTTWMGLIIDRSSDKYLQWLDIVIIDTSRRDTLD